MELSLPIILPPFTVHLLPTRQLPGGNRQKRTITVISSRLGFPSTIRQQCHLKFTRRDKIYEKNIFASANSPLHFNMYSRHRRPWTTQAEEQWCEKLVRGCAEASVKEVTAERHNINDNISCLNNQWWAARLKGWEFSTIATFTWQIFVKWMKYF